MHKIPLLTDMPMLPSTWPAARNSAGMSKALIFPAELLSTVVSLMIPEKQNGQDNNMYTYVIWLFQKLEALTPKKTSIFLVKNLEPPRLEFHP